MSYVELHTHSYYSFLEGASSPQEIVGTAKELGYKAIALTDSCGLYGAIPFYQEAKILGIKPIIGALMEVVSGESIILLCRNLRGYSNLSELITRSRAGQQKGQYKTLRKDIEELSENLICLIGGKDGSISKILSHNQEQKALDILKFYRETFDSESLYMELTQHLEYGNQIYLQKLMDLAQQFSIPFVATNAIRYHSEEKAHLSDVISCIREKVLLKNSYNARSGNHERRLKTPMEMKELFQGIPSAIENTIKIANQCHIELEFSAYRFPEYPIPKGYNLHTYLKELCLQALPRKIQHHQDSYRKRLNEELNLIENKNLSGYFLVVWDLVRFAISQDIPCQGRGSAANSLVAYLLDIAPVDPLEHNLFFGRFLNEETRVIPDIDLDFASTPEQEMKHRENVIQYVYTKYGKEYVAMACTFITYRAKSAIREVGKVLEMPEDILEKMSKLCSRYHLPDAFDELSKLKEFSTYLNSPMWNHFKRLACQILDLPRHVSIHTGGMIISSTPLHKLVPLEPARMAGRVVCQWDKDMIEEAGLVKVDLLGLRMLSAMRECVNLIHESTGKRIDLEKITPDDPKVYSMISKAATVGVFQIESRAQMQSLPRTKPQNLKELGIQVAIIRPGPLQGNMVNPYIRRKNGEEPVTHLHPSLEPILSETLGVILFQEQVLKVAVTIAGFSAGQAENLRKAMSKKRSRQAMEAIKVEFIEGAFKRGVQREEAEQIYATLDGFALYGFCKSHAMAFAKIVYQSAWLKRYYPAHFISAIINHQPMGFYPREVLIQDLKHLGIDVLPVCVMQSRPWCHLEYGHVRLGLMMIHGMGYETAIKITRERTINPFKSIFDFMKRIKIGEQLLEKMSRSGAFDQIDTQRRKNLWQGWLYKHIENPLIRWEPQAPELPDFDSWDELKNEYQVLGFSAKHHPIGLMRENLQKRRILSSRQLAERNDGEYLQVAGMVVCRQKPPTAKGFGFLTIEDESGMINLVIPPDPLKKYAILFRRAGFLIARGKKMSRDGVVNVRVQSLQELELRETAILQKGIETSMKTFA